MTAMKSNLFVLKIGSGTGGTETYTKVAALTEVKMTLQKGSIDVTTKDTAGWASMLEGGGQKSVQITASGMLHSDAETQALLKQKAMGDTNWNFQLEDEAGNVTAGRFHISQYEETGAVSGVHTFSVTLQSDGAVTYTPAP